MSDVWRELEERLKQKAKTMEEIAFIVEKERKRKQLEGISFPRFTDEWVRLEDVQKLIKEKCAVIPKEKAKKLCDLWISHIEPLDHQAENPYYFHLVLTKEEKNEFSQILKELLGFASS